MKTKQMLREATFFIGGSIFALLLLISINIARNWKALVVAMENPEIVSSLKVAQPTFEIKK